VKDLVSYGLIKVRTKLIIGLILVLSVILQSTVFDYLKIFNVKPDIVLIAVVILGLSLKLKWVMIFSYFAGFLKDMLGGFPFGINVLVLPLLGFLVFKLSKRMEIETRYLKTALVFIAVISQNLVVSLLIVLLGLDISTGVFSRFAVISSIYTAVVYFYLSKIIRIPKKITLF